MFKLFSYSFIAGFFVLLLLDDIKGIPNTYKDCVIIDANIHQLHEKPYQTAYYIEIQDGEDNVQYHLIFSSKIDQAKVNEYSLKNVKVEIEGFVGSRDFKKYIYVSNIKYPK